MLSIQDWLEEIGIDYKTGGKNVGRVDINIDCPWCHAPLHLAIHKRTGKLNCWVCNFQDLDRYPTLLSLIMQLERVGYYEAKKRFEKLDIDSDYVEKHNGVNFMKLPYGSQPLWTGRSKELLKARQYLQNRKFTTAHMRKYRLHFTNTGYMAGRIIVPYYESNKLVTYTGRDYTGSQDRYKKCPINHSVKRARDCLFGFDAFENFFTMIIVEGVFDKMRLGDCCIALGTSGVSDKQIELLRSLILNKMKSSKRILIALDPDALHKAYYLAQKLYQYCSYIKVLELDGKDPAEMTIDEFKKLERRTKYFVKF